jgi:hypothetical protein
VMAWVQGYSVHIKVFQFIHIKEPPHKIGRTNTTEKEVSGFSLGGSIL